MTVFAVSRRVQLNQKEPVVDSILNITERRGSTGLTMTIEERGLQNPRGEGVLFCPRAEDVIEQEDD